MNGAASPSGEYFRSSISVVRGRALGKKSRAAVSNCRAVDLTDSHSIFLFICCKELMSKRKANDKTRIKFVTKNKCSLKFKPELLILIEAVETELPTSSGKQLTKFGDNYTYREGSDDIVCQICQEACAFTAGRKR